MKILYFIFCFLLMFAPTAFAGDLQVWWGAPTEGSQVVEYEVQLSTDNGMSWELAGTTPDTLFYFTGIDNIEYIARVRGIDANERPGPYSQPSMPYTYTVPGTPTTVWIEEAN